MGDMGEIFNAMKEHNKQVREQKKNKYEPLLRQIGAVYKADGVWELNDWFCYPTKGFAMNKRTYKKQNLTMFIKLNTYDDCNKISENDYDMYI